MWDTPRRLLWEEAGFQVGTSVTELRLRHLLSTHVDKNVQRGPKDITILSNSAHLLFTTIQWYLSFLTESAPEDRSSSEMFGNRCRQGLRVSHWARRKPRAARHFRGGAETEAFTSGRHSLPGGIHFRVDGLGKPPCSPKETFLNQDTTVSVRF